MVTIREKLKNNKLIFKLWTKYYNNKTKKINERKTKGKGNQTGTGSFVGGWTRMNEQGAEMFQLPNRTKIYPSGKTDAMLSRELKQTNQKQSANISMTFNINTGGNVDEKILSKLMAREIERALVNIS